VINISNYILNYTRTICLINNYSGGMADVTFSFSVEGVVPGSWISKHEAELENSQAVKRNIDRDMRKSINGLSYPSSQTRTGKMQQAAVEIGGFHGVVSDAVRAVHQRQAEVFTRVNTKLESLKKQKSSPATNKKVAKKGGSKKK
jgi:hypothetical protein